MNKESRFNIMMDWFDTNLKDVCKILGEEQLNYKCNENDWSDFEKQQSVKLIEVLKMNIHITSLDKSKFKELYCDAENKG